MPAEFSLEIFFEQDQDSEFAVKEAGKLRILVGKLAPHIRLNTRTLRANSMRIFRMRCGDGYIVPVHKPSEPGWQTLLITHEVIGTDDKQGRGTKEVCCVSKQRLEEQVERSADITIHEWLHTLEGKELNGRTLPCPDDREGLQFEWLNADGQWYAWYTHILRWE